MLKIHPSIEWQTLQWTSIPYEGVLLAWFNLKLDKLRPLFTFSPIFWLLFICSCVSFFTDSRARCCRCYRTLGGILSAEQQYSGEPGFYSAMWWYCGFHGRKIHLPSEWSRISLFLSSHSSRQKPWIIIFWWKKIAIKGENTCLY